MSVTEAITYRVRPALPTDEDAMAARAEQLGYIRTGAEARKRLDDMRDPTRYGAFVAVRPHGEVVGWIARMFFGRSNWYLLLKSALVLDRTLRSRGIGKALVKAAEDWASSIGPAVISVNSKITREHWSRLKTSSARASH